MKYRSTDQQETRYLALLPNILGWIDRTLESNTGFRRSIRSFGFHRLSRYFSETTLANASVVVVSRVPVPPLSALGLAEFKAFESQDMAGITYKNTYFLQAKHADSESVHFHELVHVVQWRILGPEAFLLLYAKGLARYRYKEAPLEQMAFMHQARFDVGDPAYAVESEVLEQTLAL